MSDGSRRFLRRDVVLRAASHGLWLGSVFLWLIAIYSSDFRSHVFTSAVFRVDQTDQSIISRGGVSCYNLRVRELMCSVSGCTRLWASLSDTLVSSERTKLSALICVARLRDAFTGLMSDLRVCSLVSVWHSIAPLFRPNGDVNCFTNSYRVSRSRLFKMCIISRSICTNIKGVTAPSRTVTDTSVMFRSDTALVPWGPWERT